jgi:hypothetical protein
MKLVEALEILKRAPRGESSPFEVYLVSSFTPLHLQTFLAAELQLREADRAVHVRTGLYGDIRGNLARMARSDSAAAAIVLEWEDFDGRLGMRSLGSWPPNAMDEILHSAREFAAFLENLLRSMPVKFPVSLSSPSLPLLPVSHLPSWTASQFELSLKQCLASLLLEIES